MRRVRVSGPRLLLQAAFSSYLSSPRSPTFHFLTIFVPSEISPFLFFNGTRAVSYTHLDVYKRQKLLLCKKNKKRENLQAYLPLGILIEVFTSCLLYTSLLFLIGD